MHYNAHTNAFMHVCRASDGRTIVATASARNGEARLALGISTRQDGRDDPGCFTSAISPADLRAIADGLLRVADRMDGGSPPPDNVTWLRPQLPASLRWESLTRPPSDDNPF